MDKRVSSISGMNLADTARGGVRRDRGTQLVQSVSQSLPNSFIRLEGISTKKLPPATATRATNTPSHLSVAFSTAHALLALVFSNLASQSGTSCPASRAIRARAGAHSLS